MVGCMITAFHRNKMNAHPTHLSGMCWIWFAEIGVNDVNRWEFETWNYEKGLRFEKSRIFHPYQVWHWPKYTSAKVLAKNWIFLFYQIWPTKTWDINFKELKPSCYRWTGSYGCNPIPFWLVPRPAATPIQCHFWILILVYTVHHLLHAKFRPIDFMISPLR
jgi:hypothetical protein